MGLVVAVEEVVEGAIALTGVTEEVEDAEAEDVVGFALDVEVVVVVEEEEVSLTAEVEVVLALEELEEEVDVVFALEELKVVFALDELEVVFALDELEEVDDETFVDEVDLAIEDEVTFEEDDEALTILLVDLADAFAIELQYAGNSEQGRVMPPSVKVDAVLIVLAVALVVKTGLPIAVVAGTAVDVTKTGRCLF